MNSTLLECRLLHRRFSPRVHRFENRIFFFALDLGELETTSARLALFSRNRRNLYSLRDRDFLMGTSEAELPAPTLLDKVRLRLAEEKIATGEDLRVVLVAIPRIVGYLFNPVVFYFCYGGDEPLCALAEVTNTFREVKTFLVPLAADGRNFEARLPKEFYVSPFTECDGEFSFSLRFEENQFVARIDEYEGGRLVLHSVVVGRGRPLTDWNLGWFAIKYPLLGMQVMARIHTQALRLYLKRVPWWRKADQAQLQKNFYRPGAPPLSETQDPLER